jgi:hypothetical protein
MDSPFSENLSQKFKRQQDTPRDYDFIFELVQNETFPLRDFPFKSSRVQLVICNSSLAELTFDLGLALVQKLDSIAIITFIINGSKF